MHRVCAHYYDRFYALVARLRVSTVLRHVYAVRYKEKSGGHVRQRQSVVSPQSSHRQVTGVTLTASCEGLVKVTLGLAAVPVHPASLRVT